MLYYDVGYERIELVDRDAIFFKKAVFDVNRQMQTATFTHFDLESHTETEIKTPTTDIIVDASSG
eukprot:gene24973-32539_t